jgi:hypothetical protein
VGLIARLELEASGRGKNIVTVGTHPHTLGLVKRLAMQRNDHSFLLSPGALTCKQHDSDPPVHVHGDADVYAELQILDVDVDTAIRIRELNGQLLQVCTVLDEALLLEPIGAVAALKARLMFTVRIFNCGTAIFVRLLHDPNYRCSEPARVTRKSLSSFIEKSNYPLQH